MDSNCKIQILCGLQYAEFTALVASSVVAVLQTPKKKKKKPIAHGVHKSFMTAQIQNMWSTTDILQRIIFSSRKGNFIP